MNTPFFDGPVGTLTCDFSSTIRRISINVVVFFLLRPSFLSSEQWVTMVEEKCIGKISFKLGAWRRTRSRFLIPNKEGAMY